MSFDSHIQRLLDTKDQRKEEVHFVVGQKVRITKVYEERSGDTYWAQNKREVIGFFHTLGGRCVIKVKDEHGNTAGIYQDYLDFRCRRI